MEDSIGARVRTEGGRRWEVRGGTEEAFEKRVRKNQVHYHLLRGDIWRHRDG